MSKQAKKATPRSMIGFAAAIMILVIFIYNNSAYVQLWNEFFVEGNTLKGGLTTLAIMNIVQLLFFIATLFGGIGRLEKKAIKNGQIALALVAYTGAHYFLLGNYADKEAIIMFAVGVAGSVILYCIKRYIVIK